ncbi:hypothetical protein GCM10022214_70140 [Actinomadura miaoliensis]|uniref:Uncharacterized protein n=2 Tax=Actinomadura miaoliensis TaxID=430685 RepID=A0ABP7WTI8_9ACTN
MPIRIAVTTGAVLGALMGAPALAHADAKFTVVSQKADRHGAFLHIRLSLVDEERRRVVFKDIFLKAGPKGVVKREIISAAD